MKCTVVIADGIKQIMFTPENKAEKLALSMIDVDNAHFIAGGHT